MLLSGSFPFSGGAVAPGTGSTPSAVTAGGDSPEGGGVVASEVMALGLTLLVGAGASALSLGDVASTFASDPATLFEGGGLGGGGEAGDPCCRSCFSSCPATVTSVSARASVRRRAADNDRANPMDSLLPRRDHPPFFVSLSRPLPASACLWPQLASAKRSSLLRHRGSRVRLLAHFPRVTSGSLALAPSLRPLACDAPSLWIMAPAISIATYPELHPARELGCDVGVTRR